MHTAHALAGAIDSLLETIPQNAAALAAKDFNPAPLVTALTARRDELLQTQSRQDNLNTDYRNAVTAANRARKEGFEQLTNAVEMLSGLLGKKTAVAGQVRQIRVRLNHRKHKRGGVAEQKKKAARAKSGPAS